MTSPPLESSPERFSLRSTLLVAAGLVVLLGVTAPWMRTWGYQRQIVTLWTAFGILVGGGGFFAVHHWKRGIAKRRGGRYYGSLVNQSGLTWSVILGVVDFAICFCLSFYIIASAPSIVESFGSWAPCWLAFFVSCISAIAICAIIALEAPIEARQFGLVVYNSLRPWDCVIACRWRDDKRKVVLTVRFPEGNLDETYVVPRETRIQVKAILSEKVPVFP